MLVALVAVSAGELDDLLGHRPRFVHAVQCDERLRQRHHRPVHQVGVAERSKQFQTLLERVAARFVVARQQMGPANAFQRQRDLATVAELAPHRQRFLHPGERRGSIALPRQRVGDAPQRPRARRPGWSRRGGGDRACEELASFDEVGSRLKEPGQRADQLETSLGIRSFEQIEGRAQVVVLDLELLAPRGFTGEPLPIGAFGQIEHDVDESARAAVRFVRVRRSFLRILTHGLEQAVARLVVSVSIHDHERLVDEPAEPIHDLDGVRLGP